MISGHIKLIKMIPLTLQIKTERFLENFIGNIPSDKELHLLIDLFRLEEYPCKITSRLNGTNQYIFDYFILDNEEERNKFFLRFHEFKDYYIPLGKSTKKLTPDELRLKIVNMGYNNVTKKMISRWGNPIKVKIRVDKLMNKQYRRYQL
jgi:hypothetical protein